MTNKKSKPLKILCLPSKTTSCLTCVQRGAYGRQSSGFLAAKLNAYGLETSTVRLIFYYLTNRKTAN